MREKVKKMLGFPYALEYEKGFNQNLVRTLYKPLLMVVLLMLLFTIGLVVFCTLDLDFLGPPEVLSGFLRINIGLLVVTAVVVALAVIFRRQLLTHPRCYLLLCNGYAVVICIWSSFLSAYAHQSLNMMTALVYVYLVVSLVALFKPWQAFLAFAFNFGVFCLLLLYYSGSFYFPSLLNAAFASFLGAVISSVIYRYRARNYYNNLVIVKQNAEISSINLQLKTLVYTDDLTGARNRRYFDEVMPKELNKIRQAGQMACVMMLDIDLFKQYNDMYGHQAGDICLRRVVEVLWRWVPDGKGCFARYGGEEFVLLLPVASREEAFHVADSIRRGVESIYINHPSSNRGVVTVSIGFDVCGPKARINLSQMANRADEALYYAKNNGRNQVAAFSGKEIFMPVNG